MGLKKVIKRCGTCGSDQVWDIGADVHINTGHVITYNKWFCDVCVTQINQLIGKEEEIYEDV